MKIGMLWWDNDPKRPLAEKIQRARDYYHEKYGVAANAVYVNPADVPAEANLTTLVPGVLVETSRTTLRSHLWLGVVTTEVTS